VERASHGPGLDEATLRQRAADLAGPRRFAPHTDRELGRRSHLRLNTAQATDHPGDGQPADWIQQLPTHSPCECLLRGDLHGHLARVSWPATRPRTFRTERTTEQLRSSRRASHVHGARTGRKRAKQRITHRGPIRPEVVTPLRACRFSRSRSGNHHPEVARGVI
jgi:hypothetical protein